MAKVEEKKLDTEIAADVSCSSCACLLRLPVRGWRLLPRLEITILLLGLALNAYGKYRVLKRWLPHEKLVGTLQASLTDVAFLGAVLLLVALVYSACHWKWASRLAILAAVLYACWSVANMGWLVSTGVQIHRGVLANLFRDPVEFGPIVTDGLLKRPRFSIPLAAMAVGFGSFVVWRLVRPEPVRQAQGRNRLRVLIALGVMACALGGDAWARGSRPASPRRAALSYSSHWFAITSLLGSNSASSRSEEIGARKLARQGERDISPPPAGWRRPHIVMIVLESVGYWATSMGGQPSSQTPTLTALAREGALFENTRAVVTHTTQSQFNMLTGALSNLDGAFVEAVLVDSPYESLATLLRPYGYRSRFSQMVRATFECNPGLVANLGFDSFWAREDLQDPSTHLGYFSGDDFKMIEPAFDWFDRQDGPSLMLFMTSVAHHPYEVPSWYGSPIRDSKQAYHQTVRYTDDFVKKVVDELRKRGIDRETLLCVIADHGEGFGEHDILQHGENPYEQALRIPWILKWPARLKGGRVVEAPCCTLDVTPTILSLLGFDTSRAGFEGLDALSPIPRDRTIAFSGWEPVDPAGFVKGRKKVIFWPRQNRAYEYDLVDDPAEVSHRSLSQPETDRVRRDLADWRNRSRVVFDPKRYRQRFLFDHWQTWCTGNDARCYYVPGEAGVGQ